MSRIEELERRVRQDPASITFGALAEEYRRAGRLDDAVAACRAGLARHPSYVSARVTLGRALQELGHTADARAEYEYVLSIAPDNLAATRGLAEMHGSDAPDTSYAAAAQRPVPVPRPVPAPLPPPPDIPDANLVSPFGGGEPDFAALDTSIAEAGGVPEAQRAAQIERLEIWLARLDELRRDGPRRA